MGIFELLRTERSFRFLWLGQVVSQLGDWFQIVALVSMFPTRGAGATIVAALVVSRHLVATLTTPIAGIVADRFHRGRVMIATDVGRMVIATCFLLVRGPEDVVLIFVLSLLLEALATMFEPARGAAIPQVLPTKRLYTANALSSATWSAGLALGAMAGGATSALFGRKAVFALNAASFAASAFLVWRARVPPLPEREAGAPQANPLRDAREGLDYLRRHPAQASLLLLKPGALLSGGFFVLVSVFADQIFAGDNALTTGFLLGSRGLGALIAPFAAHRLFGGDVRGVARAVLSAFPLAMIAFTGFAFSPSVPFASFALVFAHGGTAMMWVGATQLLQLTVPNRVLGRVLAIEYALVTAMVAGSSMTVGALLAAGIPPRTVAVALASTLAAPLIHVVARLPPARTDARTRRSCRVSRAKLPPTRALRYASRVSSSTFPSNAVRPRR